MTSYTSFADRLIQSAPLSDNVVDRRGDIEWLPDMAFTWVFAPVVDPSVSTMRPWIILSVGLAASIVLTVVSVVITHMDNGRS